MCIPVKISLVGLTPVGNPLKEIGFQKSKLTYNSMTVGYLTKMKQTTHMI